MPEIMSRRGFILGNDKSEYLKSFDSRREGNYYFWVVDPVRAMLFSTSNQAKRAARTMGKTFIVFQIDESPDRYYLTSVN
jgi:hypothetical protein